MPSLLEATDYELFDYKHADERPATLEEALKKVATLRDSNKSHFHRIIAIDDTLTKFRVISVSREEAYADVTARANKLRARFLGREWPVKRQQR
jgi:hypothetical protein